MGLSSGKFSMASAGLKLGKRVDDEGGASGGELHAATLRADWIDGRGVIEMAIGGNSGQRLRVPEKRRGIEMGIDVNARSISPDEESVPGRVAGVENGGDLLIVLVEREVGPVVRTSADVVKREGHVRRTEANQRYR